MGKPLQLLVAVAALAVIGFIAFYVWMEVSGTRVANEVAAEQAAGDRRAIEALCRDVQDAFGTGAPQPRGLSGEDAAKVMARCIGDHYL